MTDVLNVSGLVERLIPALPDVHSWLVTMDNFSNPRRVGIFIAEVNPSLLRGFVYDVTKQRLSTQVFENEQQFRVGEQLARAYVNLMDISITDVIPVIQKAIWDWVCHTKPPFQHMSAEDNLKWLVDYVDSVRESIHISYNGEFWHSEDTAIHKETAHTLVSDPNYGRFLRKYCEYIWEIDGETGTGKFETMTPKDIWAYLQKVTE